MSAVGYAECKVLNYLVCLLFKPESYVSFSEQWYLKTEFVFPHPLELSASADHEQHQFA